MNNTLSDPSAATAAAARSQGWRRMLPWLSLATGVASALLMDRGPKRAALVATGAVAVWLTLIALHWLARVDPHATGPRRRRLVVLARRSSLLATQSLVQLALFFALPFYFQAAALPSWHILFLLIMAALSAVSLWDPLSERLLTQPLFAPLLPAVASFAALAAVLPGLGLSTQQSLWVAALTAALGVALLVAAAAPVEQRLRRAVRALCVALLLPAALPLGLARVVPAAPLRLMRVEIGTRLSQQWVADPTAQLHQAPARLFCATAIWSPVGVSDRLFHVWRKDGQTRARIELSISGGRTAGYRTYSRIQQAEGLPDGTYRCSVETQAGQVLGGAAVKVARKRGP